MPIVEYPKLVYHPDGRQRIVVNADQQAVYLADGWSLTPISSAQGVSRIPAASTSILIASPNAKLKTLKIVNDSTALLKILYGDGATATHYSWPIDPGERWEMPSVVENGFTKPEHTGLVTGVWESANGFAQVTITEYP